MPITIKGIRLESVALEREEPNGRLALKSASYSLLSSTDHVLANQCIGGYGDKLKLNPSADTLKLMSAFLESYSRDVTAALGLEEA